MATNNITPSTIFENQINGSVFAKAGHLDDPVLGNIEGQFQSWRYSFDEGKQIFKATDDSGKTYVKRLVKNPGDLTPHWTQWMEYSTAEANGVQAIAVNDRALQLPNGDGAIKLEITPSSIGTYSSEEINDLIDEKISEDHYSVYEYVAWIDGCSTAEEVLAKAYPKGGETQKFYLVVYGDDSSEKSAFYTYVDSDGDGTGTWVNVNTPDLTAFVTYTDFNAHNTEFTTHVADTDVHVTADERSTWNSRLDALEAADTNDEQLFEDHINSVGEADSLHVTLSERKRWNQVASEVTALPTGANRYVVEAGQYTEAFEQIDHDQTPQYATFMSKDKLIVKSGDYIADSSAGLLAKINELQNSNNIVTGIRIEIGSYTLTKSTDKWYLETDTGVTSDQFDNTASACTIQFSMTQYPDTIAFKNSSTNQVILSTVKVYILYYPMLGVNFGDPNKKLAINLVGPEDAVPTYNGTPLSELTGYGQWGQITGSIADQKDLETHIAELLSTKLSGAGSSTYRYDVFQNTLVKAICQQVQDADITTVTMTPGTEDDDIEKPTVKQRLITDIQAKITSLKEDGYTILGYKFTVKNIACSTSNDADLPVYFYTNNDAIEQSPQVTSGEFVWDWPGQTQEEFNSIFLGGNAADYLTDVSLAITVVKYGDIEIGLPSDTAHPNGYSITISGKDIALAASGAVTIEGSSVEVKSATTFDDTLTVHGQEVDSRYANKSETANNEAALASADAALDKRVTALENADTTTATNIDALKTELTASITAETEARTAADTEVEGRVSEAESKVQNVEASVASLQTASDTLTADLKTLSDKEAADVESINTNIDGKNAALDARVTAVETSTAENKAAIAENATAIETNKTSIEALQTELKNYENDASILTQDHLESYDLVISSDDELNTAVLEGTFEKAARILFKTGTYHYTGATKTALDFSNIKYIKGEFPCKVYAIEDEQAAPKNYENTLVDNIYMQIGYDTAAVILDSETNGVLSATASGDTTIELNDLYSIYKISIEADANITFTNVKSGKDYTFLIDQGEELHTVSFTNTFTNGTSELNTALDNQTAGYRTVIKATALNDVATDAFILNEVIYGVLNEDTRVGLVPVVIGNVAASVHNASYTRTAVNYSEGDSVGKYYPGTTFSFAPRILDGFAHSKTRDYDYIVYVKETSEQVATGKCDETTVIKVPSSLKALSDGSMPTLVIDFNVDPQLVTIKLADGYSDYMSSTTGFTTIQTAGYEQTAIDFTMKSDFYCYRITDSLGNELQGSLPWVYSLPANASREDYEITITPKFYAAFSSVDMEVSSKYNFDKSSIALPGENDIAFEAAVSDTVKADANYGKLYGQAPISLVASGNGCTMTTSYVDSGSNTTDQEGVLTVPESLVGETVTLQLTWPGLDTPVTKNFTIANVPASTCTVEVADVETEDGAYVLDTDPTDHATFNVSVNWGDTASIINKKGTWRISNSNATIQSSSDDTAVIAAQTKGKFVLYFTSAVTGDEYKCTCIVKTHAASIKVADIYATTSSTVTPSVVFYNKAGTAVDASVLTDPSYKLTVNSSRLTVDGESLVVDNQALADSDSTVNAEFVVTTNDGSLTATANVIIRRKQYVLQFEIVDSNITGITQSSVGYKYGGTTFTLSVNYTSGTSASDTTIANIKAAFDDVTIAVNTTGLLTVSAKMPYENVTVELA